MHSQLNAVRSNGTEHQATTAKHAITPSASSSTPPSKAMQKSATVPSASNDATHCHALQRLAIHFTIAMHRSSTPAWPLHSTKGHSRTVSVSCIIMWHSNTFHTLWHCTSIETSLKPGRCYEGMGTAAWLILFPCHVTQESYGIIEDVADLPIRAHTSPEPPASPATSSKLLKHELLLSDSVHQGEFPPSQTVVQKHQSRPPPEFSKGREIDSDTWHGRWTVHPRAPCFKDRRWTCPTCPVKMCGNLTLALARPITKQVKHSIQPKNPGFQSTINRKPCLNICFNKPNIYCMSCVQECFSNCCRNVVEWDW